MEVYNSIKKLRNYWFDAQYLNEIMQDIENLIKEIKILENHFKDNEHKGYDNTALEMKILHLKSKQKSLSSLLKKMIRYGGDTYGRFLYPDNAEEGEKYGTDHPVPGSRHIRTSHSDPVPEGGCRRAG